jgi:hypothetical protein
MDIRYGIFVTLLFSNAVIHGKNLTYNVLENYQKILLRYVNELNPTYYRDIYIGC